MLPSENMNFELASPSVNFIQLILYRLLNLYRQTRDSCFAQVHLLTLSLYRLMLCTSSVPTYAMHKFGFLILNHAQSPVFRFFLSRSVSALSCRIRPIDPASFATIGVGVVQPHPPDPIQPSPSRSVSALFGRIRPTCSHTSLRVRAVAFFLLNRAAGDLPSESEGERCLARLRSRSRRS